MVLHVACYLCTLYLTARHFTGIPLGPDSLVSSPGRDSRDIRSSRLAKATQKPLGTNAL